jgi:hypothetical protein
VHVDRVEQLEHATRTASGGEQHRALFFEGSEGIGKTALLKEMHLRHAEAITFYVDLGTLFAESDVLNELARQASRQGVRMDSFRALRQRYGETPSITFNQAEINRSSIDLAINVSRDRSLQNAALTDEVVASIGESASEKRAIIFLDSFEKCGMPMRDWISSTLLPDLLGKQHVSIFLAGRNVPSLHHPHAIFTRTLVLPPFDASIVEEWIEASGIEDLKGLGQVVWRGTAGLPSMIEEFLSNYRASDWRS